MKTRWMLLAGALLTAAMASGAPDVALAHDFSLECSPALLDGLYIFAATGWGVLPNTTPVPDPLPPKAIIEWVRFNGDGTLSSAGATKSLNGMVSPSPGGTTGTYTLADVDTGCQGTVTFGTGQTFDIFTSVFASGEIWMIQTNQNNVFRGNATKVAR